MSRMLHYEQSKGLHQSKNNHKPVVTSKATDNPCMRKESGASGL